MTKMFFGSKFNKELSAWNVSNVVDMSFMFDESPFNGDISKWNVSNVKNMYYMFFNSQFNGDLSEWDISNVIWIDSMFDGCNAPSPWWYIKDNDKRTEKIKQVLAHNKEKIKSNNKSPSNDKKGQKYDV